MLEAIFCILEVIVEVQKMILFVPEVTKWHYVAWKVGRERNAPHALQSCKITTIVTLMSSHDKIYTIRSLTVDNARHKIFLLGFTYGCALVGCY